MAARLALLRRRLLLRSQSSLKSYKSTTMPAGQLPIPVPKFSSFEIKQAELCSQALWEGIDFRTNELAEISDELLLNNFYVSFQHSLNFPRRRSLITEPNLRQLIRVAELKAMYRSTLPIDFNQGIASIKSVVMPTYRLSTGINPTYTRLNGTTKAIMDLSLCWVNNPNNSLNGNYRVPFSSRLLFFCTPELMVFNFSNELARKMRLQTRPQAALPQFNALLEDGMRLNRALLRRLKLPEKSALSQDNWNKINTTDWWQRRVLDLALLIKFGVSVPHSGFTQKARAMTRPARKTP